MFFVKSTLCRNKTTSWGLNDTCWDKFVAPWDKCSRNRNSLFEFFKYLFIACFDWEPFGPISRCYSVVKLSFLTRHNKWNFSWVNYTVILKSSLSSRIELDGLQWFTSGLKFFTISQLWAFITKVIVKPVIIVKALKKEVKFKLSILVQSHSCC